MSANPWAEALWLTLGFGLLLYALSGGADLGAGVWSLLARGPRRDAQREAVSQAIAPIWEANHVWLIFVIVVLFSAFPRAFAVLGIAFHIPIALSLVGIVLRGAAFSFHAYGIQTERSKQRWERVFAWSSSITPVFLGLVVGGVSTGRVRVSEGVVTSGWFAGWTTPFALAVGLFALGLFALLSACYLAAETDGDLSDDFRRRAIAAELVAALLALLVFLLARLGAPELFEKLASSPWTWPVQALTAALAVATIYFSWRKRAGVARLCVVGQVAMVVIGWGLAMDHHFVRPDVTIHDAGTRPEVLPALVIALGLGAAVLAPALYYLYRVFKLEKQR